MFTDQANTVESSPGTVSYVVTFLVQRGHLLLVSSLYAILVVERLPKDQLLLQRQIASRSSC